MSQLLLEFHEQTIDVRRQRYTVSEVRGLNECENYDEGRNRDKLSRE